MAQVKCFSRARSVRTKRAEFAHLYQAWSCHVKDRTYVPSHARAGQ